MSSNQAMLSTLIGSLDADARGIDQTFAMAGRHLGEGLSLFEVLKERLVTLSGELSGSEIAQAGATLTGLAGELRRLEDVLGGEIVAMRDLATHSHAAGLALERLLEHMRLITILARSARIEAVSVPGVGRDFGDFAAEIVALTTQAQHTIETCARDHRHLTLLLDSAMAAQRDFEGRYGEALSGLAEKLGVTLAKVSDRQGRSVALTAEAGVHSGKIALAAGGAIIALQSGDNIRQRLDHAITALRLLVAVEAGTGDAQALGEDGRRVAALVLRQLEAVQLDASAAVLGEDAEAIETALALLQDDTAALLDLVRTLYRGDGDDSASFLRELETDLAQASDLLGKCDDARAGIDRVTEALSGVLDTCQTTIDALAGTVSSIVLIGMNAGLRAARIGADGRSLVVIAQELKIAADQVSRDSGCLPPLFERMQSASQALRTADRIDAGHFAELDLAMRRSLSALRSSADRLGAALDQLMREGEAFHGVLGQARLGFSNAGAISDAITSAGHALGRSSGFAGTIGDDVRTQVQALMRRVIWPTYTMVAERDIHTAVMQQFGMDDSEAAELRTAVPAAAETDEMAQPMPLRAARSA